MSNGGGRMRIELDASLVSKQCSPQRGTLEGSFAAPELGQFIDVLTTFLRGPLGSDEA